MDEDIEDVQGKTELKEEFVLSPIESGADTENCISKMKEEGKEFIVIKKEEEEFAKPFVDVAKEENHLVQIDSETKPPILTSLIKNCSVVIKNEEIDTKKITVVKEKTEVMHNGDQSLSCFADDSQTADSAEGTEVSPEQNESNQPEGEPEESQLYDEGINCIVIFESGEFSLDHVDQSNCDKNVQYNDCEETFESTDNLLKQTKKVRTKGKGSKFSCKTCGMEFKYKANFKKHEKLHNDEYNFKCKYCNIIFKQSLALRNHYIHKHETDKPFKCQYCDNSFKSLNNLKSHTEVHHNFTGETFSCEFCQMEFKRRCYLSRHLLIHTNPDKKFTCDDCGLKCRSKTDIAKHVLTHIGVVEKRFFCEICSAGFTKHAHLIRHRRTHSVEKSFPCELCDRAYKDQYSLKIHHETVHLGITYSCEICGFQSDRHSLKKHLKRCVGQKKYTCEVCKKEYYLKKWFEHHISKCYTNSQTIISGLENRDLL